MSQLSDDESSDSSSDFFISADKINLNLSFFKQSVKNSNLEKDPIIQESANTHTDFDYSNDNNINSSELLSKVLKNLEVDKNKNFVDKTNQLVLTPSKTVNSKNYKGDDLSKEIRELLLQGESSATICKQRENEKIDKDSKIETETNYTIPQNGVQIHLPGDNFIFNKKRKRQQDFQKLLQNKFNQRIRISQIFIHKVGLLCWLAHGFFLNKLANDPDLLRIVLPIVPCNNYPKNQIDLDYIEKFTKWFKGKFKICEKYKEVIYTKNLLMQRISEKKIHNYKEIILLYVATVRGMGINCRLVISLQPPSLKPRSEQLFKFTTTPENNISNIVKSLKRYKNNEKINIKQTTNVTDISISKPIKVIHKCAEELGSSKKMISENSFEANKTTNINTKNQAVANLKRKITKNSLKSNKTESKKKENVQNIKTDNDNKLYDDIEDQSNISIVNKLYLRTNKIRKQGNSKYNIPNNKKKTQSESKTARSFLKRKFESSSNYQFSEETSKISTNDNYFQKKPKQRLLNNTHKNQTIASTLDNNTSKCQKLLSSDEDNENIIKNTYDMWVEVYVESEESWISVNILDQNVNCVSDIYRKASNPISYIVAWNSAGTLKDVTRRYCPYWLTDTRKKRIDEKWLSETLSNWKESKTEMSKIEDEQLLLRELQQPLPKTITECKGHPLYVLIRHLLKFEALYPPNVVPLGHLKTGEAIYSRHCVYTLCSRETWIKQARVVKPAQEAYKIVKAMPKYDKLSGVKIKDQSLELFGKWQTIPYVPPEAKDGKVPRNEYGNVDLFKKCMLPKGTVHINLPALNRIARKLNIDCAPACVGFNFGCRGALPAFKGFVVCEEFKDVLCEAWKEEQREVQKQAAMKREKRIYGNWKKLIRGLLIRETLAVKYNFRIKEDEMEN